MAASLQVAIMGEVDLDGLLPAWDLLGSIDLQVSCWDMRPPSPWMFYEVMLTYSLYCCWGC